MCSFPKGTAAAILALDIRHNKYRTGMTNDI